MLEPEYGEHVIPTLDKIEGDPGRKALWNAICDAIDLVCDHPESAEARREGLTLVPSGTRVWQVPIRCYAEDENWVLVWYQDGECAVIQYIGPWGFPQSG